MLTITNHASIFTEHEIFFKKEKRQEKKKYWGSWVFQDPAEMR
jgi:hypothetical protein